MNESIRISREELREESQAILCPDEVDGPIVLPPHKRLCEHFGLDLSYFQSPMAIDGDRKYDHLIEDPDDPVNTIIESTSVPQTLIYASLKIFADSLITYCSTVESWGVYRYYPSVLMTIWAAFESWVRIISELFVKVATDLPQVVADSLMEVRPIVKRNGNISSEQNRRSTLDRYWLFLKYACNIDYDRGSKIWQNGEAVVEARDEIVHYKTQKAPTLTMEQVWDHMEAVFLLFIGPSADARRTLLHYQYEYYWALVELQKFIIDFEERPLHKGRQAGSSIIYCPFDKIDETRYPKYYKERKK